jgi:hypothetical protein
MMTGIERCKNGTIMSDKAPKKKIKKIDRIVRGVLIYWIIFVITAWVTFWIKDAVPDTLIQYGLGGGAVELLITGVIEIARDRMSKKEDET